MGLVNFDHTIVPSTDKRASADFFATMLGLPPARTEEPFLAVDLSNDVALYFAGWDTQVKSQHYAFLISDDDFDSLHARLNERDITYWADAQATLAGQINHDDGGRGVYFRDPDGHFLEMLTVRYGGRPLSTAARSQHA
jgi:catechol 2,3-dioxygenase-like lactoylglutathione lyase family enzyme